MIKEAYWLHEVSCESVHSGLFHVSTALFSGVNAVAMANACTVSNQSMMLCCHALESRLWL